jgi:IS1 family transposase
VSNVLPAEKRLAVLAALVDGNSERAVERITERVGQSVTRKTIGRFAMTLGTNAQYLHNAMAFGLKAEDIEQDEIWSYVRKKQARVTPEESAAGFGEAYSFVSLAMPARYVITWKVGKRTAETAAAFEADTRCRVTLMPRITTDGFNAYPAAIGGAFGVGVDYSQGVKHYTKGGRRDDDHRYEPARNPFLTKHVVFGAPDLDTATTAHLERNNGTMRHFIGRMRRLVYAFSKDPAHHAAAVALAYVYYNLCWIPRTMRITPAMAIGVTTHPWDLPELLDGLLSAKPCELPEKQPLAPRVPTTTARPLPNGRGFLRVVPSGSGGPASPSPAPTPTTPAAPAAPVAPRPPSTDATGQLDLLAWRPRPDAPPAPAPPRGPSKRLPPGQLGLFGIDLEPEE